jgi:hypothetical protein
MIGKTEAQKVLDQLNQGSYKLGDGEDRPEWVLIDLDEQTGRALVVSKECVVQKSYDAQWRPVTWETCTLRGWLNSDFYNRLPEDLRSRVIETEIENKDRCSIPGGNDTKDLVFLLSIDEYNELLPESLRAARLHGAASWWWLRSPGFDDYNIANVNRVGGLDGGLDKGGKYVGHGYHGDSDSGCVRPAMFLDLA